MPDASANPGADDLVEALIHASNAIASTSDLDGVLAALLEQATRVVPSPRAAIVLHDPDRATAEAAAAIGEGDFRTGPTGAVPADHPALDALRTRTAAPDRRDASGTVHVDVPLVVARDGVEEGVGVLTLELAPGASAGDHEVAFLTAVASLAAVAVDRSRLASMIAERSEWYERMAHSDPLTGLANIRTFGRVLELELARAGRQGGEVSIAVFDIDGFVETNEASGREAGDDVLRAIAVVLNESVRLVDTVARLGGDEFVLVAPGSAGTTVARRVLSGVAALEPVGGKPVSVSAGIARFPADGTTSDELLDAAMRALAEARGRGPGNLEESVPQAAG